MKNNVHGLHGDNADSLSHLHAMQDDPARHEIQPDRLPASCDPTGGMPRGGAILSDLAADCPFALYRFAGRATTPLLCVLLRRRAAADREDPARLGERCVLATAARPPGALIWSHGASVGGSLTPKGGHNPLEPARLRCALVTGPHCENSAHIAEEMAAGGAVCRVRDDDGLVEQVGALLGNPEACGILGAATESYALAQASTLDNIMEAPRPRLDQAAGRAPEAGA